MRKQIIIAGFLLGSMLMPQATRADPILLIVKEMSRKVIKAIDLAVQRLQNQTLRLQNAQKVLENALSKLKLQEIGDWVEKQRAQYADYFEELRKVKLLLTYYHRVREVIDTQGRIVAEYRKAYALFKKDRHFTARELAYMGDVYSGLLDASLKNLEQLDLVIRSFQTQMTDARRMDIINKASDQVNGTYQDLQAFNNQNKILSLQRSKSAEEIQVVKAMYGLP